MGSVVPATSLLELKSRSASGSAGIHSITGTGTGVTGICREIVESPNFEFLNFNLLSFSRPLDGTTG